MPFKKEIDRTWYIFFLSFFLSYFLSFFFVIFFLFCTHFLFPLYTKHRFPPPSYWQHIFLLFSLLIILSRREELNLVVALLEIKTSAIVINVIFFLLCKSILNFWSQFLWHAQTTQLFSSLKLLQIRIIQRA